MLSSDFLLTHYDPSLPIAVAADASSDGVGAVILHVFPDGTEKARMRASQTLTSSEKRYGQIEKEAQVLVFPVRRFHKLIYGRRFTLLTEQKPLLFMIGSKKSIPAHSANRLQMWALILLSYDFQIQYRSTVEFGQADTLSRLISNHKSQEEDAVFASLSLEDTARHKFSYAVRVFPVTANNIHCVTRNDPVLQKAIEYVQHRWPSEGIGGDLLQLFHRRKSLCIVNDCLMFRERV